MKNIGIITGATGGLVQAVQSDFEKVKAAYIEIINHTPGMDRYARWEYGKHPTDESIKAYIDAGNMYMFMDGEIVVGVVAITFVQGDDYHPVKWQISAKDDEVVVLHLLGITPKYHGAGVGRKMLQEVWKIASEKKMKACRVDTLASNIPAQKFYERLGFVYCGKQHWYADNTGWTDFYLYEYELPTMDNEIEI